MSNSPIRVKRAIQTASKAGARVTAIGSAPQSARSLPDADAHTPKGVGLGATGGLAAALGVRKSEPRNTIKFERAPAANLLAMGLGMSRKAPSIVVAYGRADDSATAIEAFANAGAHEYRREGAQGRNVLRALINSLSKGDTLMLSTLAELSTPRDLPKVVKTIEDKGIRIITLDGADTATAKGREKIATKVLASRQLFGGLRL